MALPTISFATNFALIINFSFMNNHFMLPYWGQRFKFLIAYITRICNILMDARMEKKPLKSFYYSIFSNIILFKYFLPFFMSIEIISTKKSHATGIAMVIFFSSSMHSFHMLHKIASYAKFFWTIFTFPIFSALMNNWKKFSNIFII